MPTTQDDPPRDGTISLAGADWLVDDRLQRLIRAISGTDEEVRIVGGAIRNALMGRAVADVDLATTATPATVLARTRHHDMRPIPTGIDHGTITVVVCGKPFEVTTLRQDIATDGRHAIVTFGRDWEADARRRDFTVNALYATADGTIVDLVDGIADCAARRIRFIGDPYVRIREDYLRILRFFRFQASFGEGAPDPASLAAASALRDGLKQLSAERIGEEILKLVVADQAAGVIRLMQTTGILSRALGPEAVDVDRFARLIETLHAVASASAAYRPDRPEPLLIATLAGDRPGACDDLARRLRLSNAIRDRMRMAQEWSTAFTPDIDDRSARALVFRARPEAYRDALLLSASAANWTGSVDRLAQLLAIPDTFPRPNLPLSGRDLQDHGFQQGPQLGQVLGRLVDMWIASDFTLTRADLIARLPELRMTVAPNR